MEVVSKQLMICNKKLVKELDIKGLQRPVGLNILNGKIGVVLSQRQRYIISFSG